MVRKNLRHGQDHIRIFPDIQFKNQWQTEPILHPDSGQQVQVVPLVDTVRLKFTDVSNEPPVSYQRVGLFREFVKQLGQKYLESPYPSSTAAGGIVALHTRCPFPDRVA